MKIVYVTQRLPFGEGETFVVPEVEALLAAGHELLIVPRRSRDAVVHDNVGALLPRTRVLPRAGAVVAAVAGALARAPRRTAGAFWRLRRTRPRRRAIANAVATAQGIWLARIAREWGADHIHAHWAHLTATLAMGASAVSGIPWSFTAHRYDVFLNNLLTEKLRSARFGRFIAREMLAAARPLVAPDAFDRAVVVHMGVALPAGSPMGCRRATTRCCCARRASRPSRATATCSRRRRGWWRGGSCSSSGWRARGPSARRSSAASSERGLGERVRLLGTVPHAELLGMYRDRRADCVVLPSLHEGLSVALVEAMAYGVPVIATAVGGVPELLENGAGVLVPPRDADALTEALARVLGSSTLRAELAQAGRRRVEAEFEVGAIARELVRRFDGAAAGEGAG